LKPFELCAFAALRNPAPREEHPSPGDAPAGKWGDPARVATEQGQMGWDASGPPGSRAPCIEVGDGAGVHRSWQERGKPGGTQPSEPLQDQRPGGLSTKSPGLRQEN